MNVFLTIFSGVTVYVLGQILMKLLIEPIHGYKATVGEISIALVNLANIYANPGVHTVERNDAASCELRMLASKLSAQIFLIPCYDWTAKVFRLPSKDQIHEVKSNLIGLSNGVHDKGPQGGKFSLAEVNSRRAQKICNILGIFVPENEKID